MDLTGHIKIILNKLEVYIIYIITGFTTILHKDTGMRDTETGRITHRE
jgi:hypothetical protein